MQKIVEYITTTSTATTEILKSPLSLFSQRRDDLLARAEQKRAMHILDERKQNFAELAFWHENEVIFDEEFAEKALELMQENKRCLE